MIETTASSAPVRFEGRLIAEALRIHEAGLGSGLDDRQATAAGRAAAGDLERKIVVRAGALAAAEAVVSSLARMRTAFRLTVLIALLLAASAGAVTALTALDAPAGQAVVFHWALLGLLGVESLVLLLWLLLIPLRPGRPAGPSFGLLLSSLARWLAGRLGGGGLQSATIQATGALTGRGAVARWSLSAVSHGVWLAFLAGALAMTLLLLSTKQVSFVWQTTILDEASYLPATEALAALPRLAGFPVPDRAQILASRWRGSEDLPTEASGAWAGLLVGSLVLYGLAPRALLLGLCLLLWRRALRGLRLDLARPEYQRLKERLMPTVRHDGVIDRDSAAPDDRSGFAAGEAVPVAPIPFQGPVAVLWLELEAPAVGWPPRLEDRGSRDLAWRDLGAVDSRDDRARILAAAPSTGLVLVAVSLLTTPDRGIGAFLRALRAATAAPIALLLSDAARLDARLGPREAALRLADWRGLAADAGIPAERSVLFDLVAPDARDLERLATLLGIASS